MLGLIDVKDEKSFKNYCLTQINVSQKVLRLWNDSKIGKERLQTRINFDFYRL